MSAHERDSASTLTTDGVAHVVEMMKAALPPWARYRGRVTLREYVGAEIILVAFEDPVERDRYWVIISSATLAEVKRRMIEASPLPAAMRPRFVSVGDMDELAAQLYYYVTHKEGADTHAQSHQGDSGVARGPYRTDGA